jgi:choline-sulfatase
MYSGRLAATLGCYDNGTLFPADVPTFLHHLRMADYEVVSSGKQHFVGPDQLHGYERRLTTDIYPSGFGWTKNWNAPVRPALGMVGHLKEAGPVPWTTQLSYDEEVHFRALEQLRAWGDQARSGDRERPFFFCVSYTHPHDPPLITPEWWDVYDDVEIDMPETAPGGNGSLPQADQWLMAYLGLDQLELSEDDVRRSRRGYYAMTSYFDARVGDLISTLEQQGLADDTLIIVTSDHGDMVGEHGLWFKRSYYDWSARVPFILSWPGHHPEGRRVEAVTSLVDLYPTLLEMLDLPRPDWTRLDGHSFAGLVASNDADWKDEAVVDFTSAGALHPWRAVRQGRFKYVAVHGGESLLFDLSTDPDEWHNLAGSAAHRQTEDRLRRRAYSDWDPAAIEREELRAQQERLFLAEANQRHTPVSWDYQPFFDASQMFSR